MRSIPATHNFNPDRVLVECQDGLWGGVLAMEKIRIVVAGIGGRGAPAASALSRSAQFDLVGLVDSVPQRCSLLLDDIGLEGVAVFRDVAGPLAELAFDALAVFTPDRTHGELVIPALEAGKYVFVDKPLEVTWEKLEQVIAADRRAGGRTFVGLNLRYAPVYRKIYDLVRAGVVGQILTIQTDEFYDGGRTYFRRWNRKQDWGGGLWITKACHDFDILYWMAAAPPARVYADCSLDYYTGREDAAMYCRDCKLLPDCPDRYEPSENPKLLEQAGPLSYRLNQIHEEVTGLKPDLCLFNSDKDTFDHGISMVTFTNQVIGTYTLNVVAGFTDRRLRIGGTKATIDGHLKGKSVLVRYRDPSREEEIRVCAGDGAHGGGDQPLFDSFAAFVRGEPTAFVAPLDAAVSVRMGLAARDACEHNHVVTM